VIRFRVGRSALGAASAVIFLAGCAASQTGMSGAVPQSSLATTQSHAHRASGSGDLLYVATDANFFYVVNYTTGKWQQVVYMPGGVGGGACSDTSGNVFIAASNNGASLYKFAHGGQTPIATLSDGNYYPRGCSVDPTTGNLAVTNNNEPNCYNGGNVAIYRGASGSPTTYTVSGFECLNAASYDNQGDLFIGGSIGSGDFGIAELPNGSSQFTNITLNKPVGCYGECYNSIQWDGQYVAITQPTKDHVSPTIYRVAVSGSSGTIAGTVTFKGKFGKYSGMGALIDGSQVIFDYRFGSIATWNYPAGGKIKRIVVKGLQGYIKPGLALSQ
jgi:hypothetical protein